MSDNNDTLSKRLGARLLQELGVPPGQAGPADAGAELENSVIDALRQARPDLTASQLFESIPAFVAKHLLPAVGFEVELAELVPCWHVTEVLHQEVEEMAERERGTPVVGRGDIRNRFKANFTQCMAGPGAHSADILRRQRIRHSRNAGSSRPLDAPRVGGQSVVGALGRITDTEAGRALHRPWSRETSLIPHVRHRIAE